MEQLKVKKKETIVINVIIYLILAYMFLCIQHAYRHHLSPFSVIYFKKSSELFWYISLPCLWACILVWRHQRYALWIYDFCVLLISFKVIEGLFIEFNKIIVIALFFYAVISFFIHQLLAHYLTLASINANYSSSDLFDPLLKKIPCSVEHDQSKANAYLTNWDEDGCFIRFEEANFFPTKVKVLIQFQGREFTQEGEVVAQSTDFKGLGIKFEKTSKDLHVFNWSEFTELVHELGFKPERLR